MTRARDDRRRNARRDFAMYHDDRPDRIELSLVGSFTLGYADGCSEAFTETGDSMWADFAETHVPGSHDEMVRLLVEPRRQMARRRFTRDVLLGAS